MKICELEKCVQEAKGQYQQSLKNLEQISNEIHERRGTISSIRAPPQIAEHKAPIAESVKFSTVRFRSNENRIVSRFSLRKRDSVKAFILIDFYVHVYYVQKHCLLEFLPLHRTIV